MSKRKIINKILPPSSRRRRIVARTVKKYNKNDKVSENSATYEFWIENLEPKLFKQEKKELSYSPPISVVVPCYNTPEKYIVPLVKSLINQTYSNWELCLADGSTNTAVADFIKEQATKDTRIKYKKLKDNKGIVGNTNEGIEYAAGEFIAFLDHDDTLSEHALKEVVLVLNEDKDTDLIYSDEDKLSDDGKERLLPFFKPDWSPELLLGVNYITHFTVARKSLVDKVGGLRVGFDGAQDYDFLLRLTEQTDKIKHIPKILYHWRLADGSTAKTVGEKNYADTAGQRALSDAVKRRNIKADVLEIVDRPTNYRLKYKLPSKVPKVSIIIPFKDKADLLKVCIGSILDKSTYKNYELILISNNSTEKELAEYLDQLKQDSRCKVHYWNNTFNYSAINNFGRSKAKGEYLIFLNNDTEVITPGWIEELVGVASQEKIGAVGAMLYYPNQKIQHAGVVLGMGGMAGHVFRNRVPGEWTDYGLPSWPRNYLAVTGACLTIKAKVFDKVGGLDEEFIMAGNDVALGITLHEAGYRNVFWPFAELIHHENVSVESYSKAPPGDYNHSLDYYRPYLNWNDPYFNDNLDLMNEHVSIRGDYE